MNTDTPSVSPGPTTTYVRCKACGFVVEESKLGDLCPACGVKRAMFAPDTEKLSEKRRRVLDAHIHPIIVHLPQAFAVSALALSLAHLAVPAFFTQHVWHTLQVVCVCLPFAGVAAFLSGWYDGKVRFRKVSTPLLKRKIAWGSAFTASAVILAVLAPSADDATLMTGAALTALSAVCFACSIVLGRIGASLTNAKFSG